MGFKMSNLNQLILSFEYEQNFKNLDFYVSKSNAHVFNLINNWSSQNERFLNIVGEKFCGKSHLINIFLEKNKGLKINSNELNNHFLKKIKFYKNIILEDLTLRINEKLFYSLINIVEAENKHLIVTSDISIVNLNFKLSDLKSRSKNFTLTSIENPDDDLIFALVLKNLSDRQISINKKLIDYIIKRIDRSYSNISDFVYKIDQLSLKKKRSIDFRIIKEALGD
ncbi:MAG: DNA replication protein [Pelagibacterales bacterium MED-G44]|nr:MAG: DNA replication protein [Pelagibacterales bacterium MED-G44]